MSIIPHSVGSSNYKPQVCRTYKFPCFVMKRLLIFNFEVDQGRPEMNAVLREQITFNVIGLQRLIRGYGGFHKSHILEHFVLQGMSDSEADPRSCDRMTN